MSAPDFYDPPCLPTGFRCASTLCGIKPEGRDLALFVADRPCEAAAVFTRNRVPGAPVVVGRELIRGGVLQAVVVNSRVANVGTGPDGVDRARRMGAAAARELGIPPERVREAMTEMLARDGEGASRLLRVSVRGAAEEDEAREVARSLASSLLVKTMVHGGDPNVGRSSHRLRRGRRSRAHLLADAVELEVDLGVGGGAARGWGCDLGPGYIVENAAYYSS